MQVSTAVPRTQAPGFSSTVIAHVVFVPTGVVTVMLGPLLPLLAARWSLNDAQSGYLISAQFVGALLGTAGSSIFLPLLGFRACMSLGAILMTLGVGTLVSGGFALGCAAVFCYGAGIGLTIPAGNLAVAANSSQRRSSSLNLLNFSWSAGAVSCPILLAYFQKAHGSGLLLHGIAVLLGGISIVLVLSPREIAISTLPSATARSTPLHLITPAAILLGVLFLVYVGTENALGAWLASFAKRMNESSGSRWMLVSSYFYGALLLGRALAPLTIHRLGEIGQACFGVLLALLSSAVLIASQSIFAISLCAFFAGFGLATVYPITIGLLPPTFGDRAKGIAGFMFALSTLGGAIFPWLVGFVSTKLRSLRAGLVVPLAGCVLMLAVFLNSRWRSTPTQTFSHAAGG